MEMDTLIERHNALVSGLPQEALRNFAKKTAKPLLKISLPYLRRS
jgi:hypothetical protein